jgi:hypothetical protein
MRTRQWIAALVLLVAAQGAAAAYFYTGATLMERCTNTKPGEANANVASYNECVGYLAGISDATDAAAIETTDTDVGYIFGDLESSHACIPENANLEQLRQVFLRHMRQRPEKWHLPASGLVLYALAKALPCKK